jgi:dTDP-4-dehydrorhamnose 3,5-epimerase
VKPIVTSLRRIDVEGGDVLHALKSQDKTFRGFGEAYFSLIKEGFIKAWRRHHHATLNLVVPSGEVRFITTVKGDIFEENILSSQNNFARLTIPPGLWLAFQGLQNGESIILNISDRTHRGEEIDRCDLNAFSYEW